MTDEQLRASLKKIMRREIVRTVAIDLLVELVKEEKSLSYGLGYQDGQRRAQHRNGA